MLKIIQAKTNMFRHFLQVDLVTSLKITNKTLYMLTLDEARALVAINLQLLQLADYEFLPVQLELLHC